MRWIWIMLMSLSLNAQEIVHQTIELYLPATRQMEAQWGVTNSKGEPVIGVSELHMFTKDRPTTWFQQFDIHSRDLAYQAKWRNLGSPEVFKKDFELAGPVDPYNFERTVAADSLIFFYRYGQSSTLEYRILVGGGRIWWKSEWRSILSMDDLILTGSHGTLTISEHVDNLRNTSHYEISYPLGHLETSRHIKAVVLLWKALQNTR